MNSSTDREQEQRTSCSLWTTYGKPTDKPYVLSWRTQSLEAGINYQPRELSRAESPKDGARRDQNDLEADLWRSLWRSKVAVPRYAVGNDCCYLWTPTFAVEPSSRREAIGSLSPFYKTLRRQHFQGVNFPAIGVVEVGGRRGRLGPHFLTQQIPVDAFRRAWTLGKVDRPEVLRTVDDIRHAGTYLTKQFELETHGVARYVPTRGFAVPKATQRFATWAEAHAHAVSLMGQPTVAFSSDDLDQWNGQPAWFLRWSERPALKVAA